MSRKGIFTILITFLAGCFAGLKACQAKYYWTAKTVAKELLENTAESITPCELILVTRFNQEEENQIVDFSQYEKNKRVGLIINKTDQHPDYEETGLDDDIIVYPRAVVYKIGDQWLWKVL